MHDSNTCGSKVNHENSQVVSEDIDSETCSNCDDPREKVLQCLPLSNNVLPYAIDYYPNSSIDMSESTVATLDF